MCVTVFAAASFSTAVIAARECENPHRASGSRIIAKVTKVSGAASRGPRLSRRFFDRTAGRSWPVGRRGQAVGTGTGFIVLGNSRKFIILKIGVVAKIEVKPGKMKSRIETR